MRVDVRLYKIGRECACICYAARQVGFDLLKIC